MKDILEMVETLESHLSFKQLDKDLSAWDRSRIKRLLRAINQFTADTPHQPAER